MEHSNQKVELPKKGFNGQAQKLQCVSLKDVPLDVRRSEAKKPLFLVRYE